MFVLITGSNRGLGLSFTKLFLEKGYTVFACRRKISKGLNELKNQYKDKLIEIKMDVSIESSVRRASKKIKKITDRLDILINNAAIYDAKAEEKYIEDVDIESVIKTFKTNSLGPLIVLKYFFFFVFKAKGTIVNISSEAGSIEDAWRDRTFGYCMSKASLNMLSAILANYCKDKEVKVLVIHPGWLKTDMGGKDATLDPLESARSIINLIENSKKDTKITLLNHLGEPMKW